LAQSVEVIYYLGFKPVYVRTDPLNLEDSQDGIMKVSGEPYTCNSTLSSLLNTITMFIRNYNYSFNLQMYYLFTRLEKMKKRSSCRRYNIHNGQHPTYAQSLKRK